MITGSGRMKPRDMQTGWLPCANNQRSNYGCAGKWAARAEHVATVAQHQLLPFAVSMSALRRVCATDRWGGDRAAHVRTRGLCSAAPGRRMVICRTGRIAPTAENSHI